MSDKKKLIDQMNVVLSWELAGVVQYMHHGAMVMGPERETFFKFFKEGSEEARDHAQVPGQQLPLQVVAGVDADRTDALEHVAEAVAALDLDDALLGRQRQRQVAEALVSLPQLEAGDTDTGEQEQQRQ